MTTAFETLSMGVPVVTLPGEAMVGRWSASILTSLRRPDWIAASPGHYRAICRTLADDPAGLAELRARLPGQVAGSSICDGRRRAGQSERLLRAAWRRWAQAP